MTQTKIKLSTLLKAHEAVKSIDTLKKALDTFTSDKCKNKTFPIYWDSAGYQPPLNFTKEDLVGMIEARLAMMKRDLEEAGVEIDT